MGAIKGQPAPKPMGTPVPVPGAGAKSAVDDFFAEYSPPKASAAGNAVDDFFSPEPEEEVTLPPEESLMTREGLTRGALQTLPVAGAMVGGTLGLVGGPAGSITGAAGGAIAGASLKATLEKAIFGTGPQSREQYAKELAGEAASGAGGQALGMAIPGIVASTKNLGSKAIAKIGNVLAGVPEEATGSYIKAPQAVKELAKLSNGDIATAADNVRTKFSTAIEETRGALEDPALKIMAGRTTDLSDRQVGDSIKQLIKTDVMQKYGPFQQAYGDLDAVNKVIPLRDEARRTFQNSIRSWALAEFPQSSKSWGAVKKYTDSFSAANTGAQFNSVIGDLSDEINVAFRTGETKKADLLLNIKNRANDFLEGQVESLASRIQAGKATPEEMGFLSKLAQVKGVQEPDPTKYAKALANDFLTNKARIKSDYSGFKQFMGNLEEQTKIRSKGTMSFLDKLDEVPSEKLVNKMFDAKNTRALEAMKKETPAIFEQLSRYKVKELMQESAVDGKLNVVKFYDSVKSLSPEIRNLLLSPEEQKTLASVVTNPRLTRLNKLVEQMDPFLITAGANYNPLVSAPKAKSRALRDLGELGHLTGVNMVKDAHDLGAMEHFGKATISRSQLLKTSIDLLQGAQKVMPPSPQGPVMQQAVGRSILEGGRSFYDLLNPPQTPLPPDKE